MRCCAIVNGQRSSGGDAGAPAKSGFEIIGLNAAPTGSTDTTVGRFDGSPTNIPGFEDDYTDWALVETTAAGGTMIKFTQPGTYDVYGVLTPASTGVSGLMIGLTYDAPAPMLNDNPDPFDGSGAVLGCPDFLFNEPNLQLHALGCEGTVQVTQEEAGDPDAAILRFQVSNLFGDAPVAATIQLTEVKVRVERVLEG